MKKVSKNYYKTRNLDEATYLVISGCELKELKKVGQVATIFVFDNNQSLQKAKNKFWTSTLLTVNLNKWIMARQNIKHEMNTLPIITELPTSPYKSDLGENFVLVAGVPYYYKINNTVCKAIYGKSPVHEERIKVGNCFKTKEEAERYVEPS